MITDYPWKPIDVLVQQVSALRLGEASRAYLAGRAGLYITHPQHEVVLTGTIHQSVDAAKDEPHPQTYSANSSRCRR
jgi:hypothetical protein